MKKSKLNELKDEKLNLDQQIAGLKKQLRELKEQKDKVIQKIKEIKIEPAKKK